MIHAIMTTLWSSFFAQVGIAGLILIGAVAVFIYVPLPNVRHLAVGTATACIVFMFTATHFYIEGISHEKAKWEAAEQAALEKASQARADAERDVPPVAPTPADTASAAISGGRHGIARFLPARRLRHDRYDRDNP
jgi:hypothetical protein